MTAWGSTTPPQTQRRWDALRKIWIDFDGPLCNLWSPWLGRYNQRFGDTVRMEDIKTWDTHLYVKPEARDEIYNILNEPDLYDDAPIQPGAVEAIDLFDKHGIDWGIATSCTSTAMIDGKVRWLHRHGLARRVQKGGWPKNLVPISDKHLLRGGALIDDGPHNLQAFDGVRILWDEPHNAQSTVGVRVIGWSGALSALSRFLNLPVFEEMECDDGEFPILPGHVRGAR